MDMADGKTYTEVVLEFTDRMDVVEQRVIKKLDTLTKEIGGNGTRLTRIETHLETHCKELDRLAKEDVDFKNKMEDYDKKLLGLSRIDKIYGSINAALAVLGGYLGIKL